MRRFFSTCFLVILLLGSAAVHADDILCDGVEDRDLQAEGFTVTKDGYVVGYIINTSDRVRQAVKVDIWATDKNDTRIFWRKSFNIGDMPPKARYAVREPYSKDVDPTLPTKFSFKLPNPSPKTETVTRPQGDCGKTPSSKTGSGSSRR